MAAIGQGDLLAEERRIGLEVARDVLTIASTAGALGTVVIYMTVLDVGAWAELKRLAGVHAKVRLIGSAHQVQESLEFSRGDTTVHASGPRWIPSVAEYYRMLDQKWSG